MRLIDADALKKKAYPFPCVIGTELAVTIRAIDDAPTIDPVKRGAWVVEDEAEHARRVICSQCEHSIIVPRNIPLDEWKESRPYCHKCGAKMGGLVNDG